jgi:hypothetical protein
MALASAAMLSQAPSASPCGRTGETPLPWSNQWSHQSEDEEKELERRMLKSHLASAEFLESELVDRGWCFFNIKFIFVYQSQSHLSLCVFIYVNMHVYLQSMAIWLTS